MISLLAVLLVSIFSVDFLAVKLVAAPRYLVLVPEIITAIIVLILVGRSILLRRWAQSPKYAWLLFSFVIICMIGVVAETVEPGPLVSGMRNHFKYLPLLLLPAVYEFSDRQVKILLGIFLFIAVLQVPLAFFQRFVQFADSMHTGDPVTGTVLTSNSLTMILCIAIALTMTLYVYRKISLPVALCLFFYLAAPPAINETKATVVLLPLATLGPFLLARGVPHKWRKVLPVIGMCMAAMAAFVVVYNALMENRWWGGAGIDEFLSAGHWEWYLYRGVEAGTTPNAIGRLDSILLPLTILSENWMQLLFGLGIGNVSPSFLPGMEGEYFAMYRDYGLGMTSIGNLLWETGVLGVVIYGILFVFIWRDTRRFSRSGHDFSWYGTWWSVSVIVFAFGLLYKSIFDFNELGYMFYFWSGVLASRAWQVSNAGKAVAASRVGFRLKLAGKGV